MEAAHMAKAKAQVPSIAQAIEVLTVAGYRISKPKAPKPNGRAPGLNAIGRPYGPGFDPKYRMKHKPSYAHLYKPTRNGITGISPERWTEMCAVAKAQWDHSREHGTPLPYHLGHTS
jgi:hypothetical protein